MTEGYAGVRRRTEEIERILESMAGLIGSGEGTALGTLGLAGDAAHLRARARDLERGLFTIVVVGEFKSGKSTLLNSMLGKGTLPAKATPCTAIITVLVHGTNDRVAVYEVDREEPRFLDWEQFVREFQLSLQDQETLQEGRALDRFARVQYAEIESTHRLCDDGVRLVDSPGLGEHLSRTRVTTGYLRQAQAVIVVLNATRILGQAEREFIENELGRGRLENVFFVVNRMDQINLADAAGIRHWVESNLASHFMDDDGRFDRDLYERRVFFVSARQALTARTDAVDQDLLAASGVPALEEALERFLTSGDRATAMLRSAVAVVEPVLARAEHHIEQRRAALDRPIAELEQRRGEAESRLEGLQRRKTEIERTVFLFGEVVQRKIYSDLRAFIEGMREAWDEDSRRLMDLDDAVSFKNLLASYTQAGAKERMAAAIGEQVQHYLQAKFGWWVERVPAVVEGDLRLMMAEVEAQIEEFELALDEIAAAFSGAAPRRRTPTDPSANLADLALTMQDIHGITEGMLFPSDWADVIGTMAQQAIAVFLVGTFLTGGNFLIAILAVEAFHFGMHEHEAKKKVRQELGERLQQGLRDQVEEKRPFIEELIGQRFRALALAVTEAIQRQIEEVRAEQERILRQKRDENFSVGVEHKRLCTIEDRLHTLNDELCTAVQAPPSEHRARW
ncbi:MAG TPA: dynamin family protein [Chloroflexota bacterium]|nr:dynamin family protein [Chloroflexota bacterium]